MYFRCMYRAMGNRKHHLHIGGLVIRRKRHEWLCYDFLHPAEAEDSKRERRSAEKVVFISLVAAVIGDTSIVLRLVTKTGQNNLFFGLGTLIPSCFFRTHQKINSYKYSILGTKRASENWKFLQRLRNERAERESKGTTHLSDAGAAFCCFFGANRSGTPWQHQQRLPTKLILPWEA